MAELKKYPITYQGQEYEVRWGNYDVSIYKVTTYIFGIKTYKYMFGEYTYELKNILEDSNITYDSKDMYIEEVKMLFKLWEIQREINEEREGTQRNKENALKEWNGVIE